MFVAVAAAIVAAAVVAAAIDPDTVNTLNLIDGTVAGVTIAACYRNHHQVRRVLYIIRDEYESSLGSSPQTISTAADARGFGPHHQGEANQLLGV